jgi:hypothetical protein
VPKHYSMDEYGESGSKAPSILDRGMRLKSLVTSIPRPSLPSEIFPSAKCISEFRRIPSSYQGSNPVSFAFHMVSD